MSTVTLETMTEYDVEDLYDLWIDKDLWPAGDYFAAIPDLTALEEAIEAKEIQLFKVIGSEGDTLFGIVVTAAPVHVDLFAALGDELTPEMGAATLTSLLDWTFKNTEATEVLKYLDSQMSVIHSTFVGWGFSALEDEGASSEEGSSEDSSEAVQVSEESSGEEAAETAADAEATDAEAAEDSDSEDALDREPEDNEERTWSTYRLSKSDYKAPLSV